MHIFTPPQQSGDLTKKKNVSASFVFYGLEMIKGFIPNRIYIQTPAGVG